MATSRPAKSGQKKSAKKSAKKPAKKSTKKSARQQAQPRRAGSKLLPLGPGPAPAENGGDADPPIIVSGGSVTIKSAVQLTESYTDGFYYYSTTAVTVGKIKTRGQRIQEDDSIGGKFTVELWKAK